MEPLTLKFKKPAELVEMLKQRDWQVVSQFVECILDGIGTSKELVTVFYIVIEGAKEDIAIDVKRPNFKEILQNCLKDYIRLEKYEECADIKVGIEKLEIEYAEH